MGCGSSQHEIQRVLRLDAGGAWEVHVRKAAEQFQIVISANRSC